MKTAQPDDDVYLVPAVDKAMRILELMKADGRELSIAEIAKGTGWHKSSVQKLLVTLNRHGVVERDERTKRYSLGLTLAEYGRAALNRLDIRRLARPALQALVEAAGETAVLGVLQGTKFVMVDKKEPTCTIRVSPFIGWRYPATATAHGKALLAWLPAERVDEILRAEGLPSFSPHSLTDPAAYRKDLDATRARGYSAERDEFQDGVSGVAAPVFDPGGHVVASISLVGPSFRISDEQLRDYGLKCVEVAAELSRGMSS